MNKKLAWMRILLVALLLMCSVATPVVAQQALDIAIDPDPPIQGQILTVTVTSGGNPIEGVLIQFSLSGGTPFYDETNGTGQAVFKPELVGTLKIVATKDGYASETMETSVELAPTDEEPPVVTDPSANPSSILADGNTTSQLNVTVKDNVEVANVIVDLSALGGLATQEMTNSPGTDIYTATTTAAEGTIPAIYLLNVNATDTSGNYNNTVGISLEVTELPTPDTTPPTVTGAPTGTNVPVTTTISATFSEAMNTTSAEAAFSIPGVAGMFSWDTGNTTMTFKPSANLDYSKPYIVTIEATATDLAGNGLDGNKDGTAEGTPTDDYTWTFTTESAPAAPAAPARRGGGGGAPREPEMNVPVDPETGAVLETTLLTVDGATLTFPKGTIIKDAEGNPLATSIFMLYAPTIAESVGAIAVYDFGPGELTFEPAIDLVIPYDPADIPAGMSESDLVIRMWDGTAWIDFVTSIDTETHVATAKVSHFTIFGLFAAAPVAPPPVTPTPVVTPPPAVTPTPTPTPPVPVVPWVIVLIAIVAAVIIVAVAYVVLSRRKS